MTTHPGTFKFQYGDIVRHVHTKANYLIVGVFTHPEYGNIYDIETTDGFIYEVREEVIEHA